MRQRQPGRWRAWLGGLIVIAAVITAACWFLPDLHRKQRIAELCSAASRGDVRAVEAALASGIDVNARDSEALTALMHAARGDHPNISNPAPTDHPEVVELLVTRGANVNARTDNGFVAIFWAARYGHDKVITALISHGSDVNAMDKDGMTALRWATTNKQTKAVEILRAAGARDIAQ